MVKEHCIPVSYVQNVNGTAKSSASSGPVGADFKPLQTTATATSYQSPPVTSTGNYPMIMPHECQSHLQPRWWLLVEAIVLQLS